MNDGRWPIRRPCRGDLALIARGNDTVVGVVLDFFSSAQYTPASVAIYTEGLYCHIDTRDIDVLQDENGVILVCGK